MTVAESAFFNLAIESLDRPTLEAYQWSKLVRQLDYLVSSNPFYRDKLSVAGVEPDKIRTWEDFRAMVPMTRKDELIADQERFPPFGQRLGVPRQRIAQVNLTGGTSGAGQEVHALTAADVEVTGSTYSCGCYWAGLRPGDAVLNTIPVSVSAAGQWMYRSFAQQRLLQLPVGVYDTSQKLQLGLRFGAKAVAATPSYLMTMRHVAEQEGIDLPASPIASILTATEAFSVAWARQVEEAWGGQLFEWYGATQRLVAWTCERGAIHGDQHGVLHFLPHLTVFEVLDPDTGEHVAPGEVGEVVGTYLESEASPLLRFATGDRVRFLGWNCCPCGRPLPGIESGTIVRYDDMLKVRGVNFWPAAVDAVVLAQPHIDDYRGRVFMDERQREQIELMIQFQPGTTTEAIEEASTHLQRRVADQVGLRVTVRAAALAEGEFRDERTKARRWKDERQH